MSFRTRLIQKKRIVLKIGSSTLSYPNGRFNFFRFERMVRVIADVANSGRELILVSSGAVAVGAGKMGYRERPTELSTKQALAAVGQADLIRIYQKFFDEYNQVVAQVLLTRDGIDNDERRKNAVNTLNSLLGMGIIPIINENDTVSTAEIEFGDNDTLSAKVATILKADILIMLSDIDGVYVKDPSLDPSQEILTEITDIDTLAVSASGPSSNFGTGGMATKLVAARICHDHGIDMLIINGNDPSNILKALKGQEIGTMFVSPDATRIKK